MMIYCIFKINQLGYGEDLDSCYQNKVDAKLVCDLKNKQGRSYYIKEVVIHLNLEKEKNFSKDE